MEILGQGGFNRAKRVVTGQNGCIWAKVVVFGEKLLYSCKSDCIRAKWLYLEKKWLYSVNMVVFGQIGCIWAGVVVFGQSGSFRAKWLYSDNVVVIEQSGCIRGKVVILG